MKVTTIINGKVSLILTPEGAMETEILKQLGGGKAMIIPSKVTVLQNSVEGGLLITNDNTMEDGRSLTANKQN